MPVESLRRVASARLSRRGFVASLSQAVLAGAGAVSHLGCRNRFGGGLPNRLFVHCAAVLRRPMTSIAELYREQSGTHVDLQFGGSNTLLSQIQLTGMGDVYIAADESYLAMASRAGICQGAVTLGTLFPVLVHRRLSSTSIEGITDLVRPDLRVALAHPGQAAIGRVTRDLLRREGIWESVLQNVNATGVLMPTVGAVASAVALGSADVGVVWHSVAMQQRELAMIADTRLESHSSRVQAAVLCGAKDTTRADDFLAFVRMDARSMNVLSAAGLGSAAPLNPHAPE